MSPRWRIRREHHGMWGLYYGQTRDHIDVWRRKFGGA